MIPSVWIDAERLGEHVHLRVRMGRQFGQDEVPTYDRGRGHINDAGDAGRLILRADQWPGFIKALAVGGHATGLRVIWAEWRDDRRVLWNGAPDRPCFIGGREPTTWERERGDA